VYFRCAVVYQVTDKLDPGTHEMMIKGFETYAEIWNVEKLGRNADEFRMALGSFEVVSGVLMALPAIVALLWPLCIIVVPLLIVLLMAGATYTHVMISDPPIAPLVCGALAIVLLALNIVNAVTHATSAPGSSAETDEDKKDN